MTGLAADIAALTHGWPNTGARIVAHLRDATHLRARAAEMEAQRDDYLNREWVAVKAMKAAQKELAELRDRIDSLAADYANPLFDLGAGVEIARDIRALTEPQA